MVLPLLPICITAVRKTFADSVYAWLSVICFIHFVHSSITTLLLPASPELYVDAIASLLQITAFFLLFRAVIRNRPFRELLAILFTAFLSLLITIYTLKGPAASLGDMALAESAIMITAILFLLSRLRHNNSTFLFDMPPFWIATGGLGYHAMYLITETAIRLYGPSLPATASGEKEWLLLAMRWIQYAFYIVAAFIKTGPEMRTGPDENY